MLHSEAAKESCSHVDTSGWLDARRILQSGVTSCCLRRFCPDFVAEGLSKVVATQTFGVVRPLNAPSLLADARRLTHKVTPKSLAEFLAQDVAHLAELFLELTAGEQCIARLEVVRRDACQRFHHDFVSLRMLCTYVGPGTLWLSRENVDTHALAVLGGDPSAANLAIARDPKQVHETSPMDVLLLKGASYSGHTGIGVVHRSPAAGSLGLARLVLKLDCGSVA